MIVDLTEDMILAIEVALAELQTGEWQQFVDEDKHESVENGDSELSKIIREHREKQENG